MTLPRTPAMLCTMPEINAFEIAARDASDLPGVGGRKVDFLGKGKTLVKFGSCTTVADTKVTISQFLTGVRNETFATANTIDRVYSTQAGDTQLVQIEGHYYVGVNLVFTVQIVQLNGTSPVALSRSLCRCTRIRNRGVTDFTGSVRVYDSSRDVPPFSVNPDAVKCLAPAGTNSSEKAATSISYRDVLAITSLYAWAKRQGGPSSAVIDLAIETRLPGETWIQSGAGVIDMATGRSIQRSFTIHRPVAPNSDVRLVATADTSGIQLAARWESYLGLIPGLPSPDELA